MDIVRHDNRFFILLNRANSFSSPRNITYQHRSLKGEIDNEGTSNFLMRDGSVGFPAGLSAA